MTQFVRRGRELDLPAMVECVYNRDLMVPVDTDELFFAMSKDVHEKFGVEFGKGEVLIYSPKFEPELTCMWIAQSADFDVLELA